MKKPKRDYKGENDKADNSITVQVTHLESITLNEQVGKAKCPNLFERCNIHIHSKRKRLTDPDGVSGKAVLDGIVASGILQDDSAKFVKEVSKSQEKSEVEETVITIDQIDRL